MKDAERGIVRLIALFPHEDAARELRALRAELFRGGFAGARALPLFGFLEASFLESCGLGPSKPASRGELALVAHAVAAAAVGDARPAGVRAGPWAGSGTAPGTETNDFSENQKGFRFMTGVPALFADPTLPSSLLVLPLRPNAIPLVMAVLRPDDIVRLADIPTGTQIRFNAAYVANLAVRILDSGVDGFSYEWERGAPVWLPPPGKDS